jgi:hypothetical protein
MGLLMRFLQPVDWLIAISDRYSQQAPCIVACPRGSGGVEPTVRLP